jgi:hypothetical protein
MVALEKRGRPVEGIPLVLDAQRFGHVFSPGSFEVWTSFVPLLMPHALYLDVAIMPCSTGKPSRKRSASLQSPASS